MSYEAPKRPLVYPLKNSLAIQAVTEDDAECEASSFIWPEDNNERTLVPFMLSLNEYNVLANTIDVGRDIAYGIDSIQVLWLWLRNMRCEVSICEMIIDCIQNNPATLQAIIDGLQSSDEFNEYMSESVRGLAPELVISPLIAGSCNNSVVAGKMIALVERLDTNNKDALELIEVGTNDEEKVAALLEGIPIAGELPIGDAIDFAQDILEDFEENYNGASTIDRKDKLARDLYCLAKGKPDCSLNYADLFDFFQERVGSGLTLDSLIANIAQWVILGDFGTDDLVFDGMMALQIATIRVGQEFFGINAPRIGALTRDALPSSAWMDWELCVEPEGCDGGVFNDFRASSNSWIAWNNRALYDSVAPLRGWGPDASSPSRISIYKEIPVGPIRMIVTTNMNVSQMRIYNLTELGAISLRSSDDGPVENGDGTWTYQFDTFTEITDLTLIDAGGSSSLPEDARILDVCWNYNT